MQVTNVMLASFVGGQMEVQNQIEGYVYRGEIETISIENNELQVRFAWLAKGQDYPPIPVKWIKDDRLDYEANLEIYAADSIGPSGGETGGGDRICFYSPIVDEMIVLYPPDGSKLDPAKVEGLALR